MSILFNVIVTKELVATGTVSVAAETEDEAISTAQRLIDKGELQSFHAEWGEPEYVDYSFRIDGDIDSEEPSA